MRETFPSLTSVPVFDFSRFLTGHQQERQAIADEIYQACHQIGFFSLINYGIPPVLLEKTFQQTQSFFDLPLAVKNQVKRSEQTNCGYVGLEVEHLNPERPGDLKEAFNVGKESIWLAEYPAFQATISEFYQCCITQVAHQLFRAFALGLKLPEEFFLDKHGDNFFLRLLHYPPLPEVIKDQQIRAGEHTDYGSFTLLFQNGIEGLQIRDKQGGWVAPLANRDIMTVNVGDAMQRWTNNQLQSTVHRVVNPSDERKLRSRYSIAMFCDPNSEVEISCLETCQSADSPPMFPPILAGDYLRSRFEQTYVIPKAGLRSL